MRTVGIDEVGRGCWAGPLVAGAVILDQPINGLRDSKKLTKNRREVFSTQIIQEALGYGLGWVTPQEIDSLGLTKAVQLAMLRALKRLHEMCTMYDEIIIDGNINFFSNVDGIYTKRIQTLVRADDTIPAVSAASIIAKVARDAYMTEIADQYPQYGFDRHVGYGTAEHSKALEIYGVTNIHRMSFAPIKKITIS